MRAWTHRPTGRRFHQTSTSDFANRLDEIKRNEQRRASALKAAELADALAAKCRRIAAQLRDIATPPV